MFYENKPDTYMIFDVRKSLEYPLHLHQYIEIVRVTKGLLEMQIGTEKYLLHPGDVSVSFPNVAHDYHTLSAPEETHFTILNCHADILPVHKMILSQKQPASPVVPAVRVHEDILYAEKRLFELNPQETNGALISTLCSLILCRLLPELHLEEIKAEPQNLADHVIAYIAKHYKENISLDSISNHFGIGKYALSRLFSNVLNCSFLSYINALRISYSRTLLVNTDMNITQIAAESGFNNQQTFNRVFKTIEGCTPKEYRRTHTTIYTEPTFL